MMGLTNNKLLQVQSREENNCVVSTFTGGLCNGTINRNGHRSQSFHSARGNRAHNSQNGLAHRRFVRSANTNLTKIGGNMDPINEIPNQRARVWKSLLGNGATNTLSVESSNDSKLREDKLDGSSNTSESDIIQTCVETPSVENTSHGKDNTNELESSEKDIDNKLLSESKELSYKSSAEEAVIPDDNVNNGKEGKESILSKVLYDGQLNVRQEEDDPRCDITGCVVYDDNKLAIADNWNSNVKIFEIKERRLLSFIQLEPKPWDTSDYKPSYLVTTCNNLLSVLYVSSESRAITLDRQIPVQGRSRGITSTNGMFVVTIIHPQPCIKIIQEFGNVIKVIQSDTLGLNLFKCPEYVTVNPKLGLIYVTDFQTNKVFCLTADGDVLSVYQDECLNKPAGIVIDRNSDILIAGWGSENIHKISRDGKKIQIVLESRDIITYPRALAFCEYTLFMSHYHFTSINNYLSVYSVNPSSQ